MVFLTTNVPIKVFPSLPCIDEPHFGRQFSQFETTICVLENVVVLKKEGNQRHGFRGFDLQRDALPSDDAVV